MVPDPVLHCPQSTGGRRRPWGYVQSFDPGLAGRISASDAADEVCKFGAMCHQWQVQDHRSIGRELSGCARPSNQRGHPGHQFRSHGSEAWRSIGPSMFGYAARISTGGMPAGTGSAAARRRPESERDDHDAHNEARCHNRCLCPGRSSDSFLGLKAAERGVDVPCPRSPERRNTAYRAVRNGWYRFRCGAPGLNSYCVGV